MGKALDTSGGSNFIDSSNHPSPDDEGEVAGKASCGPEPLMASSTSSQGVGLVNDAASEENGKPTLAERVENLEKALVAAKGLGKAAVKGPGIKGLAKDGGGKNATSSKGLPIG